MIERVKSLTFIRLSKNVDIENAEFVALLDICNNLLDCDPECEIERPSLSSDDLHAENPRYYEINSKNIEYSTIKYLRRELATNLEFEQNPSMKLVRDETLKAMEHLDLDDVRIRIIAFRVGAKSYCVADCWRLHKDAEPEKVEE